jgi:tRNA threonylcarbamoyladenosine biosynthesis protein TsaE
MEPCLWTVETSQAIETQALGTLLGRRLLPGDVLALAGELGAGKTAFTQGVARGMGITSAVTSPTFTLINRYAAPDGRVLQHVDCYRLENAPLEMWDAGLTDLLAGDDVVVIEWADRIPGLLPPDCLHIAFDYVAEERRRLCFMGTSGRALALIAELARDRQEPALVAGHA